MSKGRMYHDNRWKSGKFSRSRFANSQETEERIRQARERASAYRSGNLDEHDASSEADADKGPRSLEEWTDIVGKRIEEAMQRGAFDNLPGSGKPLDLNRDPFVPEDQQMAFKLLKNNDLSPAWIGDRRDILRRIDQLRVDLQQAGVRLRTDCAEIRMRSIHDTSVSRDEALDELRQRFLDTWQLEVNQLNRLILVLNLKQPLAHLEILQLRLRDELQRAGILDLLFP